MNFDIGFKEKLKKADENETSTEGIKQKSNFKNSLRISNYESELEKVKRIIDSNGISSEITDRLTNRQIKELIEMYKKETLQVKRRVEGYKNRILKIRNIIST